MNKKDTQNLYGHDLKLLVLRVMTAREDSGQDTQISFVLSDIIKRAGLMGTISKQQRKDLRQRIYVFLEDSVIKGTIKRELRERDHARANVFYLLTEKTRIK